MIENAHSLTTMKKLVLKEGLVCIAALVELRAALALFTLCIGKGLHWKNNAADCFSKELCT